MTEREKTLLHFLQTDFPLEERPFAVLAKRTGLSEEAVLTLVRQWADEGLIRRIGPLFSPAALGWKSTLCAAEVPLEKLDDFIARVNARPEVTHNYLRDHRKNVWFTLIASDDRAIFEILDQLCAETGVEIVNLPARKVFKLKSTFSPE